MESSLKEKDFKVLQHMEIIDDQFINENLITKAQVYDFLPIAFNANHLESKIRQEFQVKKLSL